jgi:hypothetical protein
MIKIRNYTLIYIFIYVCLLILVLVLTGCPDTQPNWK